MLQIAGGILIACLAIFLIALALTAISQAFEESRGCGCITVVIVLIIGAIIAAFLL